MYYEKHVDIVSQSKTFGAAVTWQKSVQTV